jgi:anti-sigma B factor antagonist
MPLQISTKETREGVFQVSLTGELDTNTHEKLTQELKPVMPRAIALVFDLKDLSYISSMGLSALFRLKKEISAKGGSFMLANLQPQIKLVFDTVQILSDNMLASLEEADDLLDSFLDKVQKGKISPHKPQT